MFKFVVFLSLIAFVFAAAIPEGMLPQLDGRIVGGSLVNITSYPYQVSIELHGLHHCGGSIYSNRVILTAAHCLDQKSASSLHIRAGSSMTGSGGQVIGVSRYASHRDYKPNTNENDVAVIHLVSSLKYSSNIRNIGLAISTPSDGTRAVVTGYGEHLAGWAPSQLQMIEVTIIGRSECSSSLYGYGNKIKNGMFCAASTGRDACQGDSGGPLVSGGAQVGVVSWGNGCAQSKYPGVYTNVAHFRSWVISNA